MLRAAVPFTLTLQTYDRFDAAVSALGRGDVDAVADERRRLFWGAQMLPAAAIMGQHTSAPVAIAFPENDPAYADLVNLTFQEILADGDADTLLLRVLPAGPACHTGARSCFYRALEPTADFAEGR